MFVYCMNFVMFAIYMLYMGPLISNKEFIIIIIIMYMYLIKVTNGIFCLSKEFTFVTMSLSGMHGEGI